MNATAQKVTIHILLVIAILVFAALSCIGGGGDGFGGVNSQPAQKTPSPVVIQPAEITATYGAEQFHLQLTAIAADPANHPAP